ncbi:hypothetical protein HDE69_001806 [Pedobacter cryoconitis]|uniref:Uncharacterized protein n=1 Tax=Pedobacter cryoconitis TaxID=188932 RepID=A0A7W9DJ35_9SPHI|nr:hypothetical protein [Pedobacter cryoconitis]MBB5620753.1 hypothetical protein [Pedobacter cryoconitis]MBB5646053.1 hypothetical protein [Pedobacter cryoconitis]
MFNFSKTQPKYTRHIVDYDYPVGMDTRPTITFGIADNIFSRQNYSPSLSFRQLFFSAYSSLLNVIRQAFQQIKKWEEWS